MPKLREKWHPMLKEKICEKKLATLDIAATLYRSRECVRLWLEQPERIPVADAIKLCELLDIPLSEIKDYFTWGGIK